MEKIEKRGRPTTASTDPDQQPRKFTRESTNFKGIRSVWKYDLDYYPNGPISVEIFYPSGFVSDAEKEAKLPKTQRKFINPANGKEVSYGRAKQLGLIK
jgi:hypothetical protein